MDMESKRLRLPPITQAAPGTLYQQIVDGIKREVSEGRLEPGAPLPSFRQLAEELLVSLITVKRAYEDLAREGIVYCRQGLGTFVAEDGVAQSRASKRNAAEELLRKAVAEARQAGLDDAAIAGIFRRVVKEEPDNSPTGEEGDTRT